MKKIALLMPYGNPHVMGWVEELKKNENLTLTIGCVESVENYRKGYFKECDSYDSVNYFFKSKGNRFSFLKALKEQDCFISLGIFSKDFFQSIFYLKNDCQVFILSEPFPKPKKIKKYLYILWSFLVINILKKRNISFLAIGGEEVKTCYTKIGFNNNDYYRFGYFPKTIPLNIEKTQNKLVFLFVGQLIKRKGIDILIKTIEYLSNNYDDWEFRIAGSGELKKSLLQSIEGNKNVTFLGLISEKEKIDQEYSNADIFFLPSYFDGWGAVVNEALSKKCSLLVSKNVFAVNGLLNNEKNGFIFDPYNFDELAKLLDKYFKNPNLIKDHKIESQKIYNEWNEKNAAVSLLKLIENKSNSNNDLLKLI